MQSILVIGMGRFGYHLAKKMQELGNDVMVVDRGAETIERLSSLFTDSYIGDCTNETVLRALGVNNYDCCFITIGEDFEASLVIASLLKKLGAKHVVAKAKQDIQEQLLKQIGADEVVFPEREIAQTLAIRYNCSNIFDYIELTSEYAIYEIRVPPEWVGKTIRSLDVRQHYRINIIAVKTGNKLRPMPGAEYTFVGDEHIVVIGQAADVFKITGAA